MEGVDSGIVQLLVLAVGVAAAAVGLVGKVVDRLWPNGTEKSMSKGLETLTHIQQDMKEELQAQREIQTKIYEEMRSQTGLSKRLLEVHVGPAALDADGAPKWYCKAERVFGEATIRNSRRRKTSKRR